jgi:hypothetical protein
VTFRSLHGLCSVNYLFQLENIFMQPMPSSGSCNPARYPFRTNHLASVRPNSSGNAEEVVRLKNELARVKRELKELKYATQQFVRSCI